MCTLEQRMVASHEILRPDRCLLACPPDRTFNRSSTATRRTRSTAAWLPDNCTHLADFLQQTVDASKFPTVIC